jgi:hypothetical protein
MQHKRCSRRRLEDAPVCILPMRKAFSTTLTRIKTALWSLPPCTTSYFPTPSRKKCRLCTFRFGSCCETHDRPKKGVQHEAWS